MWGRLGSSPRSSSGDRAADVRPEMPSAEQHDVTGLLVGAFVSGVVGSVHCVGMCGPFAVACGSSVRGGAGWHLGRLATYAALGGLAGGFGSALPGPTWLPTVLSLTLIVWFAGVLAGVLPEPRFRPPGLVQIRSANRASARGGAQLLFGLANGLLPCGLVYAALGLAVSTLSLWGGAVVMFVFGLGTVPMLTAMMGASRLRPFRSLWARRVLALVVLITGLMSVASRGGWV